MTYEEALATIEALEPRGWRLGLDRMEEFAQRAGLSPFLGAAGGPQFIHVAGTNGKGSTTAFTQSLLVEAGKRPGAFFSPYVVDYRERIQVGRAMIPKDALIRLTERLLTVAHSMEETEFGGVTKFEFETALGFAFWAEEGCDWVALEVGLGGRLDATNIVRPKVSVIVSVGLDHVQILGHTIAEIAAEKAGILKPGLPAIVGDLSPEGLAVVRQIAAERECPVWEFGRDVRVERTPNGWTVSTPAKTYPSLRPGLIGSMQPHNMALALAALDAAGVDLSEEAAQRGVAKAEAPGRFQRLEMAGRLMVLDGAHNGEAAQALAQTLAENYPLGVRFNLLTNMISGHDPKRFYEPLAPWIRSVHVVPIDFVRSVPVEETANALTPLFREVTSYSRLSQGLQAVLHEEKLPVLVTGSNYLVGEVLRELNVL